MGLLLLVVGQLVLLVALFRRAAGIALVGATASLAITAAVLLWLRPTATPELVGMLYLAVALAVWVASPASEELADPIGKRFDVPKERLMEAPEPLGGPVAPARAAEPEDLTLLHHVWLAAWPLLGLLTVFVAVSADVGRLHGLFQNVMIGTPGSGALALGFTDVSLLFGLLLVFPGGEQVLAVPLTAVACLLYLLLKNQPSTFAAAVEAGLVLAGLNAVTLLLFPLPG